MSTLKATAKISVTNLKLGHFFQGCEKSHFQIITKKLPLMDTLQGKDGHKVPKALFNGNPHCA